MISTHKEFEKIYLLDLCCFICAFSYNQSSDKNISKHFACWSSHEKCSFQNIWWRVLHCLSVTLVIQLPFACTGKGKSHLREKGQSYNFGEKGYSCNYSKYSHIDLLAFLIYVICTFIWKGSHITCSAVLLLATKASWICVHCR